MSEYMKRTLEQATGSPDLSDASSNEIELALMVSANMMTAQTTAFARKLEAFIHDLETLRTAHAMTLDLRNYLPCPEKWEVETDPRIVKLYDLMFELGFITKKEQKTQTVVDRIRKDIETILGGGKRG